MASTSGHAFLGLEPAGDGWELPLKAHLCGGVSNALFGGAGAAIAVAAVEAATGRPANWVTTQFVSPSARGRRLSVEPSITSEGRRISQVDVTVRDSEGVVVRALGAAGVRREIHRSFPALPPEAPPPDDCEPVVREHAASIHAHVDVRMARGMFGFVGTGSPSGDATSVQWLRMPDVDHDAVAVGLLGDYMLSSLGNAVGEVTGAVSLDNTVRFAGPVEVVDDWLLLESTIHVIANGLATGTGLLWHRDGPLVAVLSQTCTVLAAPPTTPTGESSRQAGRVSGDC